ncbi:hypothetical protein [Reinekea blandensis]|uniref:hypothetical protein n=1 Tax=Reinekea blandensis TaxID=374838 RepID=UPI0012B5C3B6|nr:hypothetical protein [Reinekea blandensis]
MFSPENTNASPFPRLKDPEKSSAIISSAVVLSLEAFHSPMKSVFSKDSENANDERRVKISRIVFFMRPLTVSYAATAVFYGAAYTERHFWPKPSKAFIVILQEAIVNLIGLKTPRVRFSSEYYCA